MQHARSPTRTNEQTHTHTHTPSTLGNRLADAAVVVVVRVDTRKHNMYIHSTRTSILCIIERRATERRNKQTEQQKNQPPNTTHTQTKIKMSPAGFALDAFFLGTELAYTQEIFRYLYTIYIVACISLSVTPKHHKKKPSIRARSWNPFNTSLYTSINAKAAHPISRGGAGGQNARARAMR